MSEKQIDKIKRGYNHYYYLMSRDPEFVAEIADGFYNPAHPYANGFLSGAIDYLSENKETARYFKKMLDKGQSNAHHIEIQFSTLKTIL